MNPRRVAAGAWHTYVSMILYSIVQNLAREVDAQPLKRTVRCPKATVKPALLLVHRNEQQIHHGSNANVGAPYTAHKIFTLASSPPAPAAM